MNKTALETLNDMCMEKEAATRWRKEWGGLSSEDQRRLQAFGQIASQTNETAKRTKGQSSMMKKFNINREVMADKSHSSKLSKWLSNKIGPAYQGGFFGGTYLDHFSEGKAGKPNFAGLKGVGRFGKTNLKKLYKNDRETFDEIASIIGHHEVGGEGLINRKKWHNAVSPRYGGLLPGYFSHFSPEVLHRESAAVATASPRAQEFMKNLRSKKHFAWTVGVNNSKTGYKPWSRVSEMDELKRVGGIEYGKDAVVDNKKLQAHIKKYKQL